MVLWRSNLDSINGKVKFFTNDTIESKHNNFDQMSANNKCIDDTEDLLKINNMKYH